MSVKPVFLAPQFPKVVAEEPKQQEDAIENEIDFYLNRLLQAYKMQPTSKKPAHPYRREVSLI